MAVTDLVPTYVSTYVRVRYVHTLPYRVHVRFCWFFFAPSVRRSLPPCLPASLPASPPACLLTGAFLPACVAVRSYWLPCLISCLAACLSVDPHTSGLLLPICMYAVCPCVYLCSECPGCLSVCLSVCLSGWLATENARLHSDRTGFRPTRCCRCNRSLLIALSWCAPASFAFPTCPPGFFGIHPLTHDDHAG